MARGKHLSLEEARKAGKLDQFAKEHPAEADDIRFNRVLRAMLSGKRPSKRGTSGGRSSAGSSGIPSRPDKSEDA